MQPGDPIGEGWAIYKRFWRHLVPIALVTYLVISLLSLALTALGGVLGARAQRRRHDHDVRLHRPGDRGSSRSGQRRSAAAIVVSSGALVL